MILPVFDAHIQTETYKRKNETRDWPKVVMLDSSGDHVEVKHITFDPVLNEIVLVKE